MQYCKRKDRSLSAGQLPGIMDVVLEARQDQIRFGPAANLVHANEELDFELDGESDA